MLFPEYQLGVACAYPFAVLPPTAQHKHLVGLVEVCNSNCETKHSSSLFVYVNQVHLTVSGTCTVGTQRAHSCSLTQSYHSALNNTPITKS